MLAYVTQTHSALIAASAHWMHEKRIKSIDPFVGLFLRYGSATNENVQTLPRRGPEFWLHVFHHPDDALWAQVDSSISKAISIHFQTERNSRRNGSSPGDTQHNKKEVLLHLESGWKLISQTTHLVSLFSLSLCLLPILFPFPFFFCASLLMQCTGQAWSRCKFNRFELCYRSLKYTKSTTERLVQNTSNPSAGGLAGW